MALIRVIASRDTEAALRLLEEHPHLALEAAATGATRQVSSAYFLQGISHYVFLGDTALHIAAAAYERGIAERLLEIGARPLARNRRGAEPLHYAADGGPGSRTWNPGAQAATVELLIRAGADPDSADRSGVTPLHRAVRTRCAAAVRALIAHGADPRRRNGSGSTPLHLAVQSTGRGGAGRPTAREEQKEIILFLLAHGARPTDRDGAGKTVRERAAGKWTFDLLDQR